MTNEEKKQVLEQVANDVLPEMYPELEDAYRDRKGYYLLKEEYSSENNPDPVFRIKAVEVVADNSTHVGLITAGVGFMGKDKAEDKDYKFINMGTFRFYIDALDPEGEDMDYEFLTDDKGNIDYDRTFIES